MTADKQKFSQEDMTAASTRAAKEAERKTRQKVEADLAEQLGCTVDEAKVKLAAAAKAEDDKKSAADLALEAAEAAKADAAKDRAAAAAERLSTKVERQLIAAGVGQGIDDDPEGKKAAAAIKRATGLIALSPDADDDAIAAEVEALKAELPALFSTSTGDGETPPPGVPPAKQKKATGGKTAAERATERFATTQTPLAKTA